MITIPIRTHVVPYYFVIASFEILSVDIELVLASDKEKT